MNAIGKVALLGALLLTAACEKEVILPGERLNPRDVIAGAGSNDPELNKAIPLALPAARANADWPQRAGAADHLLVNPAMGAGLTLAWRAPIGEGDSRRYRIFAEPVVAAGRVYTLDSRAHVTATSTAGQRLWQTDVTPPGDSGDDATGSGLAFEAGRVFVTSGFGELVALDAATGAVIWRQRFDAGVGGAPTVENGVVYVLARDASSWAIRAADGKVLWQLDGAPARAGAGGASAPVVSPRFVIFPHATGELVAALKGNGATMWTANVAGRRLGRGYTIVQDLTGEPVVSGGTLYAGSSAGTLSAFDLETGEKLWSAQSGPGAPVQVAGGAIFLVNDNGELQRLDARNGDVIWSRDLPYWVTQKVKKQKKIFVNYGPVLAGGKLFVPGSDGVMRVFNPANGAPMGEAAIPGGASTDPVVAGGTLYVVTQDGALLAYR